MNTSKSQNNGTSNPVSFAGTALAASYLAVFISPTAQREEGHPTFSNGMSINVNYPNFANEFIINPFIYKPIWQILLQCHISSFEKEYELKKIKSKFTAFIGKSKKNFEYYKKVHESVLEKMVDDIDIINRQKTLMKDYLLRKLYIKLQEMGIESSFSDFTVEHIDLRDFPINENYNLAERENLSNINKANKICLEIIEYILDGMKFINPFVFIPFHILYKRLLNNTEIKAIEEKIKELEKKESYNTAQMNSDMALLRTLEYALRNISCIYKDVMDKLMPIMENLLTDLAFKYNNDLSIMPPQKVEAIRNIKDILKDFSEKSIVPRKSTILKMEEDVVNVSNKLSEKHYALKYKMLDYGLTQEETNV